MSIIWRFELSELCRPVINEHNNLTGPTKSVVIGEVMIQSQSLKTNSTVFSVLSRKTSVEIIK